MGKGCKCCNRTIIRKGPTGPTGPFPNAVGLADIFVGPSETYQTVGAAFAAGERRIRIREDVTETADLVAPPYVHIWVDGGATWDLAGFSIDLTDNIDYTLEGNTFGRMKWSPSSGPSDLYTGTPNVKRRLTVKNMNLDLSESIQPDGPARIIPVESIIKMTNLEIDLPAMDDMELICPENNLSNIEDISINGEATGILGNIAATSILAGIFRNITFGGYLGGDKTFTESIIGLGEGSEVIMEDIFFTEDVSPDLVLGGNSSSKFTGFKRKKALSKPPNVRTKGTRSTMVDSDVEFLKAETIKGKYTDLSVRELDLSDTAAEGNIFSGGEIGDPECAMTIAADNTRFTGGLVLIPPEESVQSGGIDISGDRITMADVYLDDNESDTMSDFMTITGEATLITGLMSKGSGRRNLNTETGERSVMANISTIGTSVPGSGRGIKGAGMDDTRVTNAYVTGAGITDATKVNTGNLIGP